MLSRVADSCFWLSRYIERAESIARILDVNMQLLLDFEEQNGLTAQQHWLPVLATLEDQELFSELHTHATPDAVMEFVTFEKKNPGAIISCINYARENARTVREQISSEMWEQINQTYLYFRQGQARIDFNESPIGFYRRLVDTLHGFQGTTDATMTHGEGWDFLQIGKYLERADSTSRALDIKYHILLPKGEKVGGHVDITQWMAVLRSCSAMEAYLKAVVGKISSLEIARFLILHDDFPRSIRFCVDKLDDALHRVSDCDRTHFSNEAERLSGMLKSSLDFATIESIFGQGLHQVLDGFQLRLIEISNAVMQTYGLGFEEETATETQAQSQS